MSQGEKIFVAILSLVFASQVHAQSGDASLLQYYAQLQNEQRKVEVLEKKKDVAEKDVHDRRAQIESLKSSQEKSRHELDELNLNLKKVTGDIDSYKAEQKQLEQSAAETVRYLQTQRQELLVRRTALDQDLKNLEAARRKAEREVYSLAVEIDRYKVEITKGETRIQEAQTKKAAVEADEVKMRETWTEVKATIADHKKAYDAALADIAEAKKHHEVASRMLQEAKLELARMEKARNDATKRAQDEVAKYERDIAASNKARLIAEAEQIRMETEVHRVQEYATKIRAMRDRNVDMQASAESLELKSTLAVEAARNAHARAMESADQTLFKKEREALKPRSESANAREVASTAAAGRLWSTTQDCQSYSQANTKEKAAHFEQGRKLLARKSNANWVEIMNGSGASVFIESKCGKFEN